MFPNAFFGIRMFAARFFAKVGATFSPPAPYAISIETKAKYEPTISTDAALKAPIATTGKYTIEVTSE